MHNLLADLSESAKKLKLSNKQWSKKYNIYIWMYD